METREKKMDFVMIVPFQEKAAFGSRLLDAYLTEHGFKTSIVYFKRRDQEHVEPSQTEVQLLVDQIREADPLLIGFSLLSPFRNVAFKLTEEIRKWVDTPIIYGGVHATIDPDDCMLCADICCVGDGEEALKLILESLRQGKYPTDTPNCFIKQGDKIHKNPMTYMCRDLDSLPFPDLSGKDKYYIDDDELKEEDPYVTYIEKSKKYDFKAFRGCPYNCTFCGNTAIRLAYKPVGKFLRDRSPGHVIEELKMALKRFPDLESITSYDEVFIMKKDFIKEFSQKYKKEIDLPLACDTYVTLATEEMVEDIVEAGLTHVAVGIEAFSEEIRKKMYNRRQKDEDLVKSAQMFGKHNIEIFYDFIVDNPFETHEDMEQCFWNLVIQLPRPCGFNLYSLSHLPKAELTERFLKEGIIEEHEVVSFSDKGLVQWKATSKMQRDPRIEFWLNLMRLFSRQIQAGNRIVHVPRFILKFVAKKKSPRLLEYTSLGAIVVQSLFDGSFFKRIARKVTRILKNSGKNGIPAPKRLDFASDPHYEN